MSIVVRDLYHAFGAREVLSGVSFEVPRGRITALLGQNGAGKTTLMRLLTGYLPLRQQGEVLLCGQSRAKGGKALARRVAYLPEHNPLYEDMYVKELLNFYGHLYGLGGVRLQKRRQEVIEQCGLQEVSHERISILSKGYCQRLGLARVLLPRPEVLILDEPSAGLDPNQLVELRKLIHSLREQAAVLLSTHILQEVEALCDDFLLLHQGSLIKRSDFSKEATSQGASLEAHFRALTQTADEKTKTPNDEDLPATN